MLQYTAVGIQNESHMAVSRDDYWTDLKNLAGSIEYAVWNCSLDLPVRLVASLGRRHRRLVPGRRRGTHPDLPRCCAGDTR